MARSPQTRGIDRHTVASRLTAMACLLLVLPCLQAQANSRAAQEYQVKAAFLYNFAKFIRWPADWPPKDSDTIVIGVLGEDPFGDVLDRTIEGKTVRGRRLLVKRFPNAGQVPPCHILFIRVDDQEKLESLLHLSGEVPVLTVGEAKDFIRIGGVVHLFLQKGKVRFRINAEAAERAGIKISSRLLSLSTSAK